MENHRKSKIKRSKTIGFRSRMRNRNGRKILSKRRNSKRRGG